MLSSPGSSIRVFLKLHQVTAGETLPRILNCCSLSLAMDYYVVGVLLFFLVWHIKCKLGSVFSCNHITFSVLSGWCIVYFMHALKCFPMLIVFPADVLSVCQSFVELTLVPMPLSCRSYQKLFSDPNRKMWSFSSTFPLSSLYSLPRNPQCLSAHIQSFDL